MAALIKAAREEDFPAQIVLVISNRSDAGARYLRSTMHDGPPAHTPTLR